MFDKPFEQLFRALQRIENQLAVADHDQKEILREELLALRSLSDRFVEKWLTFEEKVADLADFFDLEIEEIEKTVKSVNKKELPVSAPAFFEEEPQIVRIFQTGLGYFDLLMFPAAIRELERVVEYDGDFAVARLYLALGYFGQGEYQKANQQLNLAAVGQQDPLILSMIHHTYGHIYANQKQYEQAIDEFKQTIAYMDDFKDAHFNLGVCLYKTNRFEEAIPSFQKSLQLDSSDWEAARILSVLWRRLGRWDLAYAQIQRAYQSNSSDFKILLQYAELSQIVGDLDLAKALWNRAKRFYPERIEPLGGIGWLELEAGNVQTAIAYFKKQLSLEPNDPIAHFNLGWVWMHTGNLNKATSIFNWLNEQFPENDWGKIGLARLYQFQNQSEKATEYLTQAIDSADPHIRKIGYLQAGKMALENGLYETAIEQLTKALQLDPSNKQIWYYKGVAHTGLGEDALAKHCFIRYES